MSSRAVSDSLPLELLERANVTTLSRAVLKRSRSLPVPLPFADALRVAGLTPGLVRGTVCAATGSAPVALAAVLLAEVSKLGSWIAWCAPDDPNPRALFDAGWSLDRFVCVDPGRDWLACMNACVGEFEAIVTRVPFGVPFVDVRRVAVSVARSNGVIVLLASDRAPVGVADIEFRVDRCDWNLAAGQLVSQALHVVLAGRRVVRPHRFVVDLTAS